MSRFIVACNVFHYLAQTTVGWKQGIHGCINGAFASGYIGLAGVAVLT